MLESRRQWLRSWRIPVRQIGQELGHKGLLDEELIPFLLTKPIRWRANPPDDLS